MRTCEIFAGISLIYAVVYFIFGHYPTIKHQTIEMEEFNDEKSQPTNDDDDSNQLELEETERSYGQDSARNNQYELNPNKSTMMNETVETLDNED